VTVKRVENALAVTNQGARNLIDSLEKSGILRKAGASGRGGRVFWVADDVFEAIN